MVQYRKEARLLLVSIRRFLESPFGPRKATLIDRSMVNRFLLLVLVSALAVLATCLSQNLSFP